MNKGAPTKEFTRILGVPVSAINMDIALGTIAGWISRDESRYVFIRDVHGLMCAHEDPELNAFHFKAGMVTPDGMPLVKISQWRGKKHVGRVCGADLMDALCALSAQKGYANYFFGGKQGVAEILAGNMRKKYPGLKIAGTGTPPFRTLTKPEDRAATARIVKSGAKIVWVGLSTPKQEWWMIEHVKRIPGATLIGVGAAFDFHTGEVKRAPEWMQKSGLEWFYRLISEPRRLWRRYLVMAPKFAWLVMLESLGRRSG